MTTVLKRQLTTEEEREAERLMAAWHAYKSLHRGATQTWLGQASALGSQGLIGQYLRGIIPLNLKALVAICKQIDADPTKISPRLMKNLRPVSYAGPPATISNSSFDLPSILQALRVQMEQAPADEADFISLAIRALEAGRAGVGGSIARAANEIISKGIVSQRTELESKIDSLRGLGREDKDAQSRLDRADAALKGGIPVNNSETIDNERKATGTRGKEGR